MIAKSFNKIQASIYLSIFKWLAQRRTPQKKPIHLNSSSRVLVFTCAGIGDTLTDSVVFKAFAESYPGIFCAAVVHHRRRTLAEHNPYIQKIFTIKKGPFSFLHLHHQLISDGPWDAIIHLRGNDPEPRCQSFLLDPDTTVSVPQMTQLSFLCGHEVEQIDWDQTHGVEQTLRIVRYLNASTGQPHLVYQVREEEKRRLETNPLIQKMSDKPRLVLQVGGGKRAFWRDWPEEHWAKLVEIISGKMEAEIILLGGKDQLKKGKKISQLISASASYQNLIGQLSLTESAALLQSAKAVVSTDTGIMHLAFAVGARVVALIHCNNPISRVGPYQYGNRHRVLQLEKPIDYTNPHDALMSKITPEMVLKKLEEIWI